MGSLNDAIRDYTEQLGKGQIQKAYRGILAFMSSLARRLGDKYPSYSIGALYPGLMDMSYFAFTPPDLKNRKLKIAIVYLHRQNRFEIWLGGMNRKVQAEMIDRLSRQDLGKYSLSQAAPGVDSILESTLAEQADFDHPDELFEQIEAKAIPFILDMLTALNEI